MNKNKDLKTQIKHMIENNDYWFLKLLEESINTLENSIIKYPYKTKSRKQLQFYFKKRESLEQYDDNQF
jgi:hypothetical protein